MILSLKPRSPRRLSSNIPRREHVAARSSTGYQAAQDAAGNYSNPQHDRTAGKDARDCESELCGVHCDDHQDEKLTIV